jgi:hypothetical protein
MYTSCWVYIQFMYDTPLSEVTLEIKMLKTSYSRYQ